MKFRKFIMQLGLLLAVVLGFCLVGEQSASAAGMLPPFMAHEVNKTTGYEGYATVGSDGNFMPPISADPNSASSSKQWSFGKYPTLMSIAANNTSDTGRISDETTKIYIAVSGSFSIATGKSAKITSLVPYVTSATNPKVSIAKNTPADLVSTPQTTVTPSNDYYEFDVDLKDLRNLLPLYIGFKAKTSDSATPAYMGFASIGGDSAISLAWKKAEANSTYTSEPATAGSANIKASDRVVTGTGVPGLSVSLMLDTASGHAYYTGAIKSDGTFSITLPDMIDNLTTGKGMNVTEYDSMGDVALSGASIYQVLDLKAAKSPLEVYPDDIEDNVDNKSDAQILTWLVKAAGISVTHNEASVDNSDVTFSAKQSGLATQIANLKDGEETTIDLSAALKATPSTATDGATAIKLVKHDGSLSFSSISPSLDFGSVAVPSKETLFAPKNKPDISITDTQASKTPWTVMAQASDLIAEDGRKLDGYMVYVDAQGDKQSMASAVEVAAGVRDRSLSYPLNTADGWSMADQNLISPKNGMYLDALPSIYSGSTSTTYSGTIYWELTNAPGTSLSGTDISTATDESSATSSDSSSADAESSSEMESGGSGTISGGTSVSSGSSSVYNGFGN